MPSAAESSPLSLSIVNTLDLLYIPICLLAAPFWMRKKRGGWDERRGHVSGMLGQDAATPHHSGFDRPRILLHAVSVGEVNALRTLVPTLARSASVVVSTTTDTGLAQARSLFGALDGCRVVRYPLDCSWMVDRFLDAVDPRVVGLVELEVWPNFVKRCAQRGIPIGIINGRLSARSFRGYRRIRALLRPTFSRLSFACVQDRRYADRIIAMGVDPGRVSITGSMKWDSLGASARADVSDRAIGIAREMGIDLAKPILVGGSTAPGEEALLDRACPDGVQLVVAPRKTDRFDEAATALGPCVRRSKGEQRPGATRFLLDTIGELSSVYELADLVVVGRSFFALYGSDPIEPAALGKAVLIGPAHSDFEESVRLLREADAIQVVDTTGIAGAVERLINDPQGRAAMGERARACVRSQQGASAIHKRVLLGHVQPPR